MGLKPDYKYRCCEPRIPVLRRRRDLGKTRNDDPGEATTPVQICDESAWSIPILYAHPTESQRSLCASISSPFRSVVKGTRMDTTLLMDIARWTGNIHQHLFEDGHLSATLEHHLANLVLSSIHEFSAETSILRLIPACPSGQQPLSWRCCSASTRFSDNFEATSIAQTEEDYNTGYISKDR